MRFPINGEGARFVRFRASSVLSLFAMCVSACGWHLQGETHLPATFATMRIDSEDAYTDFYRELHRSLLASGVQIAQPGDSARAVFKVRRDSAGQRVAALSTRNTPEEFQVYYDLDYSIAVDGTDLGPVEHLELTTNYSYDELAVLAKQREQHRIQEALARELATIVLRRLATAPAASSR
jgi:LPS-assembly lipoprotein